MIDQELTGIFDGGIINAAETEQEESPLYKLNLTAEEEFEYVK